MIIDRAVTRESVRQTASYMGLEYDRIVPYSYRKWNRRYTKQVEFGTLGLESGGVVVGYFRSGRRGLRYFKNQLDNGQVLGLNWVEIKKESDEKAVCI